MTSEIMKTKTSALDKFRDKIEESSLTPDEKEFILRELESAGAASLALEELGSRLKKLRDKIRNSQDYKKEKELKRKRKQISIMQQAKMQKVLGVLETKYSDMRDGRGLERIVNLLEEKK